MRKDGLTLYFTFVSCTQVGAQETSISGSQNSEPGASESDSRRGVRQDMQDAPTLSISQAQQRVSLFFALCTKVWLFSLLFFWSE